MLQSKDWLCPRDNRVASSMTWEKHWGQNNAAPINLREFYINLYGENLWGLHRVSPDGKTDLQIKPYCWIRPNGDRQEYGPEGYRVYLNSSPPTVAGLELRVLVWSDFVPGRKELVIDGQRFPFDFVVEGMPDDRAYVSSLSIRYGDRTGIGKERVEAEKKLQNARERYFTRLGDTRDALRLVTALSHRRARNNDWLMTLEDLARRFEEAPKTREYRLLERHVSFFQQNPKARALLDDREARALRDAEETLKSMSRQLGIDAIRAAARPRVAQARKQLSLSTDDLRKAREKMESCVASENEAAGDYLDAARRLHDLMRPGADARRLAAADYGRGRPISTRPYTTRR